MSVIYANNFVKPVNKHLVVGAEVRCPFRGVLKILNRL